MNVLFWNLKKKNLTNIACELILDNDADICFFSEYQNGAWEEINLTGYIPISDSTCDKVIAICKENMHPIVRRGIHRGLFVEVTEAYSENDKERFLIVGVHLSATERQKSNRCYQAREIRGYIEELENDLDIRNTVVIGDFNASPFDEEMAGHAYFNAVLFKDIIRKNDSVTWERSKIKRFYNPMLNLISEEPRQYGSYYYRQANVPLYWFCLDQVLVRRSLVDRIESLCYVHNIGSQNLLTVNGLISQKYSDHLPLAVRIE